MYSRVAGGPGTARPLSLAPVHRGLRAAFLSSPQYVRVCGRLWIIPAHRLVPRCRTPQKHRRGYARHSRVLAERCLCFPEVAKSRMRVHARPCLDPRLPRLCISHERVSPGPRWNNLLQAAECCERPCSFMLGSYREKSQESCWVVVQIFCFFF